jgi:hypothetical protein
MLERKLTFKHPLTHLNGTCGYRKGQTQSHWMPSSFGSQSSTSYKKRKYFALKLLICMKLRYIRIRYNIRTSQYQNTSFGIACKNKSHRGLQDIRHRVYSTLANVRIANYK